MRKITERAITDFCEMRPSPRSQQHKSLWTDGTTLWSYHTALMTRFSHPETGRTLFALNMTKYSRTTTDKQYALRWDFKNCPVVEVLRLPMGGGRDILVRYALETLPTAEGVR